MRGGHPHAGLSTISAGMTAVVHRPLLLESVWKIDGRGITGFLAQ